MTPNYCGSCGTRLSTGDCYCGDCGRMVSSPSFELWDLSKSALFGPLADAGLKECPRCGGEGEHERYDGPTKIVAGIVSLGILACVMDGKVECGLCDGGGKIPLGVSDE